MRSIKALTLLLLGSTLANAQATRTWVSGVGDDANPCSRTAPCKTFAGAISKTAVGGEIDALDPGGFGALTITKSITIDGGEGQVASVLVSGTNGIVVAAGASDVVVLRNLRIQGLGGPNGGLNGIRFISGAALFVENVRIYNFNQNGIDIDLTTDGAVSIDNTTISQSGGVGIRATTSQVLAAVAIDRSHVEGSGSIGVEAAANSNVTLRQSSVLRNATAGVQAEGVTSVATIDNCDLLFNGTAVSSGTNGFTFVGGSKIAFNGAAFGGSGGNSSYGTNRIHTNGSYGTFTTIPQQ